MDIKDLSLKELKASVSELSDEDLMEYIGATRNARSKPVAPKKRVGGRKKKKIKAKAESTPDITPETAAAMQKLLADLIAKGGNLEDLLGD